MRKWLLATVLSLSVHAPAWAENVVVVDPEGKAVHVLPQAASPDVVRDSRAELSKARARVESPSSESMDSIIIVVPEDSTRADLEATTRQGQAARAAAAAYSDGRHGEETVLETDGKTVIILKEGQATRLGTTEKLDNISRLKLTIDKARAGLGGQKPCGSVIVGGVGESGATTAGGVQTQDVYSLSQNCR